MLRVNARERIDLDERQPASAISAQIDAAAITAAQATPRTQRKLGRLEADWAVKRHERVLDAPLALLLVEVGIDVGLGLREQNDFHDPDNLGLLTGADKAHGELAARKVFLDQDRLLELSE